MSLAEKRLKKAYNQAKIINYDDSSKFVIMSDLHRGQGGNNDNFTQNKNLFLGAMNYYYENGFTYIEAGDGDELWENRHIDKIISANCDVFCIIAKFYKKKRFHMLYGNHDIVKHKKKFQQRNFSAFYNECMMKDMCLLPDVDIAGGIVLRHKKTKREIFITHGHQGSILNDILWPLARFLVRYVWKPLEQIGFIEPKYSQGPVADIKKLNNKLSQFSKYENKILICGHTHKPRFPKPEESSYFNSGSCVNTGYLTGIEIENKEISLVKWQVSIKADRSLYVGREVIKGPVKISDYYKENET